MDEERTASVTDGTSASSVTSSRSSRRTSRGNSAVEEQARINERIQNARNVASRSEGREEGGTDSGEPSEYSDLEPKDVKPPRLEDFGGPSEREARTSDKANTRSTTGRTRQRQSRSGSNSGTHLTLTSRACGSLFGVIFAAASRMLVGGPQINLTPPEQEKIGEAFYDGVTTAFPPNSFVVKGLTYISPWAEFIDTLSRSIMIRVQYIAQHKMPRNFVPQSVTPVEDVTHDIVAPDPEA